MSKIITDKATMQCSLGTKTATLKVTSQNFIQIDGGLIATEKDKEGMTNIPTFGNCRCVWYQPACIPQPIKWEKVISHNTVNGLAKLTDDSECPCAKGGKVTFVDTGENSFVKGE